jgi:hypothetical protein
MRSRVYVQLVVMLIVVFHSPQIQNVLTGNTLVLSSTNNLELTDGTVQKQCNATMIGSFFP